MRTHRAITAALTAFAIAAAAEARIVRDHPYPRETTWNAAIRLIRVDMGCTITERDVENGYFTFDWRDGRRTVPGSIEVVPTQVDGRPGTRVIVQIPSMPTYVESMVLTRLGTKLRAEFGEPAPPPARPRPQDRPADPAPADPAPTPVRPPVAVTPVEPEGRPTPTPPISPDAPRTRRGSTDD